MSKCDAEGTLCGGALCCGVVCSCLVDDLTTRLSGEGWRVSR